MIRRHLGKLSILVAVVGVIALVLTPNPVREIFVDKQQPKGVDAGSGNSPSRQPGPSPDGRPSPTPDQPSDTPRLLDPVCTAVNELGIPLC